MVNCQRPLVRVICICWAAISFSQHNTLAFYTYTSTRLRGMMVPTFLDEAGVRELGRWGANHIRWQLTWGGFPHSAADRACLLYTSIVVFSDMMDDAEHADELFAALQHLKYNKHEVILFHIMEGGRDCLLYTSRCV